MNEPAGMVIMKLPTWSVTGGVTGLIAGAVLLKVKADARANSGRGALPKAMLSSVTLKARKGVGATVSSNTVPFPDAPPAKVVPKRSPLLSAVRPDPGKAPSPRPVKVYSTVSVPPGVSLNTTPQPDAPHPNAPPPGVVP